MIGLHHHQPQLGLALQHVGDQAGQRGRAQAQQQLGVALLEARHGARHQVLRQAGNGRQAQHARAVLGQRVGQIVDPLHHALRLLDLLEQALHLHGRLQPPTHPLEQRHPIAFSVWASMRLTAGWEILSSRAAPLMDPAITTAHNISVCR